MPRSSIAVPKVLRSRVRVTPTTSTTAQRPATNTPPRRAAIAIPGGTADSPKPSILSILHDYTLNAGDIIYVDTGSYDHSLMAARSC